jgi:hypothetical protein
MKLTNVIVHASIALNHILDLVPEAAAIIVKSNGLSILAEKMQNFDYIELAENSIRSFEMISLEFSNGILRSGAVDIMMNLVHFLVGPCRAQILNVVKRVFKNFSDIDDFDNRIMNLVPIVRQYLSDDDMHDLMAVEIFSNLAKKLDKILGK